jgi:hypothetical protein
LILPGGWFKIIPLKTKIHNIKGKKQNDDPRTEAGLQGGPGKTGPPAEVSLTSIN